MRYIQNGIEFSPETAKKWGAFRNIYARIIFGISILLAFFGIEKHNWSAIYLSLFCFLVAFIIQYKENINTKIDEN